MNKVQQWLAKGLLGIKAAPLPTAAMMPSAGPGNFVEVNGQVVWISDRLSAYVKEGYQANDIIYSIVMMIMDKVRVAPWGLYKVEDESSLKKYQGIISGKFGAPDYTEAMRLRKKALSPITNMNSRVGKLNDLLDWPNEYGTFNDLVADGSGFKMITGNKGWWGNLLPSGANAGIPQEIINMPMQYVTLQATMNWPQRVVGYILNNGEYRHFAKEEVVHEKFWNPEYDASGSGLYGQSPIKAASKTVTRNNAAKKAGATQLDNNGAAGIAYVDDAIIPAADRATQANSVKRVWAKEYAGANNFGKVAFSGYKMGYVSVGMSLKDMALTDIENVDLRRLCNIWGLPSQLMNDPDNKTFNNQKEAEKALTSRCALPHLVSSRNHFNRKLTTDWGFKGVNVYADFDMSVYSELQEDQKEKWEWVNKLPVSSAYKLELMNLDVPDDPNLDVILVDGNLIPLADIVNNISDTEMQQINEELNKSGLKY